jgi:hypothetical protein
LCWISKWLFYPEPQLGTEYWSAEAWYGFMLRYIGRCTGHEKGFRTRALETGCNVTAHRPYEQSNHIIKSKRALIERCALSIIWNALYWWQWNNFYYDAWQIIYCIHASCPFYNNSRQNYESYWITTHLSSSWQHPLVCPCVPVGHSFQGRDPVGKRTKEEVNSKTDEEPLTSQTAWQPWTKKDVVVR